MLVRVGLDPACVIVDQAVSHSIAVSHSTARLPQAAPREPPPLGHVEATAGFVHRRCRRLVLPHTESLLFVLLQVIVAHRHRRARCVALADVVLGPVGREEHCLAGSDEAHRVAQRVHQLDGRPLLDPRHDLHLALRQLALVLVRDGESADAREGAHRHRRHNVQRNGGDRLSDPEDGAQGIGKSGVVGVRLLGELGRAQAHRESGKDQQDDDAHGAARVLAVAVALLLHLALLTLRLANLVHHVDELVGADLIVAVFVKPLELLHCLGAGMHVVEVHGG
mmetsp:Transcript_23597/g.69726  ORF Transcript_23597/g.69726 Transcript_23597/m.69726 type:complete len:280 (-) Transcript_23597:61-900(-)